MVNKSLMFNFYNQSISLTLMSLFDLLVNLNLFYSSVSHNCVTYYVSKKLTSQPVLCNNVNVNVIMN